MAEERRVVTVLFADVAGSTALGDAMDPEDFRNLLRRALLTGDHGEMESGLNVLERLGDIDQLGRFERLAVG